MKKYLVALASFFILSCTTENEKTELLKAELQSTENIEITKTPPPQIVKVDSVTVNQLKRYFTVTTDEFDGRTWWKPKTAAKFVNRNSLYFYFEETSGTVSNFRIRFQYYADDWLFIEKVTFLVDDNVFTYRPDKVDRDNGDGFIWEWFDEYLIPARQFFLEAIENAKVVKMKIQGQQYDKVKTVSPAELLSLKQSISIYKAKGGSIGNY